MKLVNKFDESGKLVYNIDIIRDIVDCALGEIDGVVKFSDKTRQARDSIKVNNVGEDVLIDVYVKLAADTEVIDVASSIQNNVKNTIENMTEFKVKDVNVHVIDLEFQEN